MNRHKRILGATTMIAVLVGTGLWTPAHAAPPEVVVVVEVTVGTDPARLASRYGVVPTAVYSEVASGFSAAVTPQQRAKLTADPAVEEITEDAVIARVDPSSFVPLRLGGRANPGAPPASVPAQPPQLVTAAIRRIRGVQSRTADIDGIDDRRVDADIAVLDGGIDPYHPDLDVAGGFDCVPGPKGQRGFYDRDGHGTVAAGLAAAVDNEIGLVGAAPGARLWAVRVADPAGFVTETSFLCGLEYVARNRSIDVANLSFGGTVNQIGPCSRPRRSGERDRIHRRICRVVDKGVTVVAAAGNESTDAAGTTPAAYDEVIAVSAIADFDGLPGGLAATPAQCLNSERDDRFASFSNFGPVVDIAAPGVCLISTAPGGTYVLADGTSFSAPLVAGAAALIHAARGDVRPARVRSRLLQLAQPGPIAGDPDRSPEGVLDVSAL